jgi:hypothetical protein
VQRACRRSEAQLCSALNFISSLRVNRVRVSRLHRG